MDKEMAKGMDKKMVKRMAKNNKGKLSSLK